MNWPKLGLLMTVIPLQWLALLYASHYGPDGILRAGIALGLFHSFQYHRLMWFHNRNRYTEPGARCSAMDWRRVWCRTSGSILRLPSG